MTIERYTYIALPYVYKGAKRIVPVNVQPRPFLFPRVTMENHFFCASRPKGIHFFWVQTKHIQWNTHGMFSKSQNSKWWQYYSVHPILNIRFHSQLWFLDSIIQITIAWKCIKNILLIFSKLKDCLIRF